MHTKNIIGLLICATLFILGFTLHGNIGLYFNISGLLIVIGGSCGAALISYRFERLQIVYKVILATYTRKPKAPKDIVEILVDLAVKSKFKGLISLQKEEAESSILFLRNALGLLVDGYSGKEIRSLLTGEMNFFQHRREACEQALRNIADFFPAFGLVGSVVGLIGMLAGVGDTKTILATIPIALTSTLYGIIFANLFFLPFAANLREQTNKELLLEKIIMEGVIAIESELNPRILERKLKSFLTPSARHGHMVSLRKIQQRFHIHDTPPPKR
jgi:chemotaxis protein MotA